MEYKLHVQTWNKSLVYLKMHKIILYYINIIIYDTFFTKNWSEKIIAFKPIITNASARQRWQIFPATIPIIQILVQN